MVIYDGEKIAVSINKQNYKKLLELAEIYDGEYLSGNASFVFPPTRKLVAEIAQMTNENEWNKDFRKLAEHALKKKVVGLNLDLEPTMFNFQKEDVEKMVNWDRNILLGSDLGTGKSCVTASYLRNMPKLFPCVIVCPATLKYNWQIELKKWAPALTSVIVSGQTSFKDEDYVESLKGYDVIIINYNILGDSNKYAEAIEKQRKADHKKREEERRKQCELDGSPYKEIRFKPRYIPVIGWVDRFQEFGIKCVVCDECQYIETPKTIRARAVRQLCDSEEIRKIFISGTPYETKVSQFFNALNLLYPHTFPDEWAFKFRYCAPKKGFFGWSFDGLSHAEELRNKLAHFMIRRKIEDVLPELPENQRIVVYFNLDNESRTLYDSKEDELATSKGMNALTKVNELKKILMQIKLEFCLQFVDDLLKGEDKVVVFLYHVEAYETFMKHFGGMAVGINGSVNPEQRQKAVENFQNDKDKRLFVGQIVAASAGITLTASHTVVFIEFGQTVGQHIQAEGRIRRIGQKKHCLSYYLACADTIDTDRFVSIEQHYADTTGIMDGNLGPDAEKMFDLDNAAQVNVKKRFLMRHHQGVSLEYQS